MATIHLHSNPARMEGHLIIVTFSRSVFPSRVAEVSTAAEAEAVLAAYAQEAGKTGIPLNASMHLAPGSRAPRGFKKLNRNRTINV